MSEEFITKIREIIETTSIEKAYSPDLQTNGENICAVTLLAGSITNGSCKRMLYSSPTFRVLIRGNKDDKNTRKLADEVINALNLLKNVNFTGGRVIGIEATSPPIYAFRDENQRIHYNITFQADVEMEE